MTSPGARPGAAAAAVLFFVLAVALALLAERIRRGPAAPVPSTADRPARAVPAAPGSIFGEWDLVLEGEGLQADYTLRIEGTPEAPAATQVSPRSGIHAFRSVTWKDGVIRMEIERTYLGVGATIRYEGVLEGDAMSGRIRVEAPGYEARSGTWTARRKP